MTMTQPAVDTFNITVSGNRDAPSTMFFAHGFGCDQTMWRRLVPHFEASHRLVLFDHIGCGKSDVRAYDPERHASIEGYAQDVVRIMTEMQLTDVTFVGHSASGMIGLLASIMVPDRFRDLVLVCPSPCYLNDPPDYQGGFERADIDSLLSLMDQNLMGWVDYLAPAVMGPGHDATFTDELRATLCALDPFIAHRFAMAVFLGDNRKDLPKVTRPALILQTLHDAIAPVAVGQYMNRHLRDSSIAYLDLHGHSPHVTDPALVAAEIKRFLNTQR